MITTTRALTHVGCGGEQSDQIFVCEAWHNGYTCAISWAQAHPSEFSCRYVLMSCSFAQGTLRKEVRYVWRLGRSGLHLKSKVISLKCSTHMLQPWNKLDCNAMHQLYYLLKVEPYRQLLLSFSSYQCSLTCPFQAPDSLPSTEMEKKWRTA